MVRTRSVIWPLIAKQQLRKAYNYIKEDSVKNADKVREQIIDATYELARHPLKHRADKYKTDNDGSFRAFELFKYRIAYHVTEESIVIVRVRHTDMEPLPY